VALDVLAWLVALVLTDLPDVVGFVIGVLVLAAGLATFFLSLLRLHRQMVEIKAGELAIARDTIGRLILDPLGF